MKIKIGTKFKPCEGPSKGLPFTVLSADDRAVTVKSETTGEHYTYPRKHFEKFLQRCNLYWKAVNNAYKRKKQDMKGN